MTWLSLQIITAIYIAGLVWFASNNWPSVRYIWGALGFTFIALHMALLLGWHTSLAVVEAHHMQQIMELLGRPLEFVNQKILLVPDSNGWVGLDITLECSTLIELSVFSGLLLFYPRLTMQQRLQYFIIGFVATYLLNLLRIGIIIVLITLMGRSSIPIAHNVVARSVYFVGIVSIYWYLLTRPTLSIIRRTIEVQGLGVD